MTDSPDWAQVPFHPSVRSWSPENVQDTVQAVSAVDPAVTVSPIWNPSFHWLTTEYVAEHAVVAAWAGVTVAASPAVAAMQPDPSSNVATKALSSRSLGRNRRGTLLFIKSS